MIRRPPRSTRTDTLFPTRRSSDLVQQARQHSRREGIERHRDDVPEGRYERRSADHAGRACIGGRWLTGGYSRSEEHTSELQSLMRISYAVFCLKKQKKEHRNT